MPPRAPLVGRRAATGRIGEALAGFACFTALSYYHTAPHPRRYGWLPIKALPSWGARLVPPPGMLETFEICESANPRGSVLWLHGLGAGPRDFESLVPMLRCSHLRFVFPAAPVRPVTLNGGLPMPAWYDILSLMPPPLREAEGDLRESERALVALIEREHQRGIAAERVVLCGFSQGGAMALHTGVRFPSTLAGIAVLSGYLPLPEHFESERLPDNANTPLLFCHGTVDPVVPLALGQSAMATVLEAGYPATLKLYEMPHSMCEAEAQDLGTFLRDCVGP